MATAPVPVVVDQRIWLSAFKCVRPSAEFAEEVGRMVLQELMDSERPTGEFAPFRKIVVEVVCS